MAASSETNTNNDATSQYYIHFADNPSGALTTILLQGTNYIPWSLDVLTSLSVKNKTGFVDGTIIPPNSSFSSHKYWLRCNNLVLAWLRHSVIPEISDSLLYVTSAKEFWDELKQRYSAAIGPRVLHLEKMLGSLSQGTSTVTSYFTKFKTLWDEYTNYRPFPKCTCSILATCTCKILQQLGDQREEDMVIKFLIGLNESFSHLRSQFLLQTPLPRMPSVYSLLLQEERQRDLLPTHALLDNAALQVQTNVPNQHILPNLVAANVNRPFPNIFSTSNTLPTRGRPYCSHCKKLGHNVDKCFQLHGYPPGYKAKPRFSPQ